MIKIKPFKKFINESKLITESQESKSISAAKKLFTISTGNPEEKFEDILNSLRNSIPSLKTKLGGKFILGAMRIYCSRQFNNHKDLDIFNNIIKIIILAHIDEYDRNLNNMSLYELKKKFGKDIQINVKQIKKEISELTFNKKSPYKIVQISSFEEAQKYHDYVDWCY